MPRGEGLGSDDPLTRLVSRCLVDPHEALGLDLGGWNELLWALRRNALLASFAEGLRTAGVLEAAPRKVRTQLTYATIAAASTQTAVRFELNRVLRALRRYDGPLVLLKGAAYEIGALPPCRGRHIGDLDLMVPRSRLDEVEQAFLEGGWKPTTQDAYDQRYYREWGHELPAFLHPERETPVDLHHTISPLTSRASPDAGALFACAVDTQLDRARVLGAADMVLHSTLHLFNDEVSHPFRDLYDIHLLLEHFQDVPGFWDDLCVRAELHGVTRPLHYMLRLVDVVFRTTIPEHVASRAAEWGPAPALARGMYRMLETRFRAGFVVTRTVPAQLVRAGWTLRAHWLRMPPKLLLSHFVRKGYRRVRDRVRRRAERVVVEPR